jgi:2-dehydropantoate 2-reductase
MRVGVLGGGALGTLVAGLLADAGREVAILDRDPDHVAALRAGLEVTGETETTAAVEAATDPAAVGVVDVLVVSVRSYQTGAAMAAADTLYDERTAVCTLQNGLGNAEAIAEHVSEDRVVAGTTAHGATVEGPGRVRHAGAGPTTVGGYFGGQAPVRTVADALAPLGVETVADARDAVWEKLLVNLGVNAPTALARVENGAVRAGAGRAVLERAVGEGERVADAVGRDVEAPVERALAVAEATTRNVSSMRADIEAGRRTEVEAVYGAVVDRGEEHGVPTPTNRTLAELIRLAESRNRPA